MMNGLPLTIILPVTLINKGKAELLLIRRTSRRTTQITQYSQRQTWLCYGKGYFYIPQLNFRTLKGHLIIRCLLKQHTARRYLRRNLQYLLETVPL
ncbi:hypothetical protein XELAEV_18020859mg [Xenopus laevis]|uniref:Uncharacterized protein n=1 Tax=Xenopus laevis TaxID=8355 RepID=A0A974D8G9_XENLA|nr:hypothetical protein XELAEV_18020859mg [Xenopus laevis]